MGSRTALVLGVASAYLAFAPLARGYTIQEFVPEGETPNVRQIHVAFSEHMVPFGDPTGAKRPFVTNTCENRGQGRWIDSKNWVFDFKKDLPAGVSCALTVDPALKAMAGSTLSGQGVFTFFTGGPAIVGTKPGNYNVAEDSAFVLELNSDYDSASIVKHAHFQVPGIASKVPVKIIAGGLRDEILKVVYRYEDPKTPDELKRVVIIQPTLTMPAGRQVKLIWAAGIATAGGIARTKAQVEEFRIMDPFVVRMECERENAKAGCVPISPIHVQFGANVSRALAAQVRLALPGGKGKAWKPKLAADEESFYSVTFEGPFPERAQLELTLPDGMKDDAGRQPKNLKSFPLKFKLGGAPPLAKFAARFGILEANAQPLLPITVRNVEAELKTRSYAATPRAKDKTFFERWYDRLRGRIFRIPSKAPVDVLVWLDKVMRIEREHSVFGPGQSDAKFDVKTILPEDAPRASAIKLERKDGKPFEVIGLELGGPGLYVVETESKLLGSALLGKAQPMYVPAAALVTNLAVHLKLAKESSLVWVTSLDKGEPVSGALVSLWDCAKNLHFKGKTTSEGYLLIDKALPKADELPTCFKSKEGSYPSAFGTGYLAVAEKGDDFSFAHSSWDGGIETWRFDLPYVYGNDEVALHAILSRSLLRAGDKLDLKSVLRKRTGDGFAMIPKARHPKQLKLTHDGSDQSVELPLAFDDQGVAVNEWQLPADAKLGTYTIYAYLPNEKGETEEGWENRLVAGNFRVEEFRIPLAKGVLSSGPQVLVNPDAVKYDVGVQYLSGGSAGNQAVVFRSRLTQPAAVRAADFEGFSFASKPLQVGTQPRDVQTPKPVDLMQENVTLDPTGTAKIVVKDIPARPVPYEIESELEYKDPSGEVQTVAKTQVIWPAKTMLGIKSSEWMAPKKGLDLRVAAVDADGKGVAGQAVKVRLFKRQYVSHRKRLVGGFYSYDSVEKVTDLGELCAGTTGKNGEMSCKGKAKGTGYVIAEAQGEVDGRVVTAATEFYVPGKDAGDYEQESGDRVDVLAERKSYEPGEKAKFQVKMPFKQASALVVVEREGIHDVRYETLDEKDSTFELDVRDDYAPNTFVSVMVARGRVEKPKADFLVDLGKPAFKVGVTELKVGIKAYSLDVKVETPKQTYQARDEVTATVTATAPGGDRVKDGEAAVAVIDEGLLQLKPNDSWKLLEAMTGQRGDTARTFTSALQVIGKRHFGLKAVAPGGGGGVEGTRSLFDAMVFWEPRLKLDGSGTGQVKFKLNDSLTSFRVVAIASAGAKRFGTGSTSIAANKDVMILPGVPPTARSGDKLKVGFTLRNTTKAAKTLTAKLAVKGIGAELKDQELKLSADGSKEVAWTLQIPQGVSELTYEAAVVDGKYTADKLVVKQKVKPAIPVRTVQATLVQLAPRAELDLAMPASAEKGRSRLLVSLSPSLAGEFAGLSDYMADYPYTCFEQRISKAVALGDDAGWDQAMSSLPSFLDGSDLVKYYPTSREGSPVLSAYLLTLAHEAGKSLPEEAQGRIVGALRSFVEGRLSHAGMSFAADLVMQKLAVIDALSRYGEATKGQLDTFDHDGSLWPTSALIDYVNAVTRIEAAGESDAKLKKSLATNLKLLKARMTYRGTTFGYSGEERDYLWWLMVSPDVNAVKTALLAVDQGVFGDEAPKIVRSTLARQGKRGRWDLTNANALGVVALRKFAEKYEREKVSGETVAKAGKSEEKWAWAKAEQGGRLDLAWNDGVAKLEVVHAGKGKPWAQIESRVAAPLAAPVNAGFAITKEVTAARAKEKGKWHVGDVVKVKLTIDSQADTGLVVVDDPIPTGASILGTGLGGNAASPASGETESYDWDVIWPSYRENGFEGIKAYYDVVPKGSFTLEYSFRLNGAGTFRLPATHVEAMYAPDTLGDLPGTTWQVLD